MYERPPTRFEHRTATRTNARSPARSPAELVRSWEAFDRLFEDAFAPAKQTTQPDYSQTQSQFTDDNQTQSAYDTPKPQKQSTLYDETPQSEFTQLYDDGATEMTADTETPLPGRYPKSYPLPEETPQTIHAPFADNAGADEIASSADEDFQRLWEEAERNRRKRMTRTVTRRRILQHGVMSPSGGTVSTIQPEPEHKQLRRKKSRYARGIFSCPVMRS